MTLGVEEEFQLLDARTGEVVSRAAEALAALPAGTPPERVQGELTLSQVEIATPVCRSLDEVRAHLEHWRHVTAEAAAQAGCVLAARVAVREYASGRRTPDPPPELLRAATFLAARDGVSGRLVDGALGRAVPAAEAVAAVVDRCRRELADIGDLALVEAVSSEVLRSGTASQRQRAAWALGGAREVLGVVAAADARLA